MTNIIADMTVEELKDNIIRCQAVVIRALTTQQELMALGAELAKREASMPTSVEPESK